MINILRLEMLILSLYYIFSYFTLLKEPIHHNYYLLSEQS